MRKVLTLQLDSLFDEYIYTDYDESMNGHSILIDYNDKKAFLKDLVDEFKERAKNLLEVEYQCEGCENINCDQDNIQKCEKCGGEVCEYCHAKLYKEDEVEGVTWLWVCDNCR